MSDTLRKTAADYDAQLASLDQQMENLKRKRDDIAAAKKAIDGAVAKLPPVPDKAAAKAAGKSADSSAS